MHGLPDYSLLEVFLHVWRRRDVSRPATLSVSRRLVSRCLVSRRAFEEGVEFGWEAQRPVVAVAWSGAEVDVVVADQVDVLVVGVVDAGDLPVGVARSRSRSRCARLSAM